jgi:hypothetical protein
VNNREYQRAVLGEETHVIIRMQTIILRATTREYSIAEPRGEK